ncbi:probable receptor-like protein kinase At1g49730 [Corylus avellana]|uniref:probable receptor-like protein kinase At1g49730 n=1 Tax=Corylus avellana TaxID=13451 RepID=UPI00286B5D72|nr:probable receptor-like protein kinase At1g49730 [Corylus avellana]
MERTNQKWSKKCPVSDAHSNIEAKLSSVICNGDWLWRPTRSEALVGIQARLPEVGLGICDKPVWIASKKGFMSAQILGMFIERRGRSLFAGRWSGPILFVRHLSYKDIKKATDGFHRIIYCNSHGTAYKARFQDGGVALVKEVTAFSQELDVFYREVQLLGRLHHRHLLPLRGFSTGNKRLLIFDNIENGSLKEHLSDPLKTPLNWRTSR